MYIGSTPVRLNPGRLLGSSAMSDDFEDHCWKDVITPDVLEVYAAYRRKVFVGASPALLAVDSTRWSIGRPRPPAELAKTHPNSCGQYAYAAIEPTKRLFAAARGAGLPVFYSTGDVRAESRPSLVTATKRNKPPVDAADYAIRPEFKPQPQDVVITKQRASVFFGTPLIAHLTQLGVQTLIICGESTSGCVRATAVDATPTASTSCWSRSAASTAASSRTRSICSTCITNTST